MFSFGDVFFSWKKWETVKLSDLCPCKNCGVNKELINNRYYYMMSGRAEEELTKECRNCSLHAIWTMDCIDKLRWYEQNDERLKKD